MLQKVMKSDERRRRRPDQERPVRGEQQPLRVGRARRRGRAPSPSRVMKTDESQWLTLVRSSAPRVTGGVKASGGSGRKRCFVMRRIEICERCERFMRPCRSGTTGDEEAGQPRRRHSRGDTLCTDPVEFRGFVACPRNRLRDGTVYREAGGDFFDRLNPGRTTLRLTRRLERLGFDVQLVPRESPQPSPPKRGRTCKCAEKGIPCKHGR